MSLPGSSTRFVAGRAPRAYFGASLVTAIDLAIRIVAFLHRDNPVRMACHAGTTVCGVL